MASENLPEALTALTSFYADKAREKSVSLRMDAWFGGSAASGPMCFAENDAPPADHSEYRYHGIFSVIDQVPAGTVIEWCLDADGSGRLDWCHNPAVDVATGRVGVHKVGRRSSAPPPIVPLTERVADNDLAEIERLLRERGHAKGFTEKQIAAAEKRRGVTFPPELKLFFSLVRSGVVLGGEEADDEADDLPPYAEVRDGLTAGTGKIGNVVDARKRWGRKDALPSMPAASAADVVQPTYASPYWVVFADDGGGNAYAIDLAPGPQGAIGQIVQFDHELDQPPGLASESLTEFLRGQVAIPEPWGPPADRGTRLGHADNTGNFQRLSAETAPTATELFVRDAAQPADLTLLRGSRTLTNLEIEAKQWRDLDLSVLPTLTALESLTATEAIWAAIVERDAWPPRLVTAEFIDSRDIPLREAVDTANAVLRHYGQEELVLESATIG